MEEKLSYLSIAMTVKRLQNIGLLRLDRYPTKIYKTLHTIYMRVIMSFFLIYELQQIMKVVSVSDDLEKVIEGMLLLLTTTDCVYKCIMLSVKPDQIENTLNVMKGPIFNQGEPEHSKILRKTIRKCTLVSRVTTNLSILTGCLMILHPLVLYVRGRDVNFNIWLPFDGNKNHLNYAIAEGMVATQTILLAFCNSTLDIFITFLFEQCRTQIIILKSDLVNVVKKSKNEAIETGSSYTKILERRFNNIVIHHQKIVGTADEIQEIFGGAVFFQFLVSGWILCCTVYRIFIVNPATVEFFYTITYVMCMLLQLFMFCFYGNEITYESDNLITSAYESNWLEMPVKQRRALLIFMERIKIPIQPMAGGIVPLSSATFISVVRSSYSFYAFLKSSRH